MTELAGERTMTGIMRDELGAPKVVDRSTFQAELDALRVLERGLTQEKAMPLRPPSRAANWPENSGVRMTTRSPL